MPERVRMPARGMPKLAGEVTRNTRFYLVTAPNWTFRSEPAHLHGVQRPHTRAHRPLRDMPVQRAVCLARRQT